MNIKNIASDFLKLTSSGEAKEAFQKYVSDDFIHHNPYFEGTAEAIMKGMIENHKKFPGMTFEIKNVISERNFVAVHSKVVLSKDVPVISVVHLFRFDKDKIAELWDIGLQKPEGNPNEYGLF